MDNTLDRLNKRLDSILGKFEKLDKLVKGMGSTSGAGGGMMDGSLGQVSTTAAGVTQGGTNMSMMATMGKQALGMLGGMAAGAAMAMPDVNMTIMRRAGFYQAGIASGGMMSHSALESKVRLGLGKFSTSQGSDAAVAAMLTTRGMVPTSAAFGRTVTAVGQAARYMNMPNEVAASALENLASGPTSAMLMRNFGIFTANPYTGEEMSQAQIFKQFANRVGGAGASTEQVMRSLREGNLGSNIRNSGLDQAQQAMLAQYFIERSRGVEMDLSNPASISEMEANNARLGISNPMLEQYRQNSLDNDLMERATEPYLRSIEVASDALASVKEAVKGLPDLFYELKGGLEFFMGDNVGQGLTTGIGSLFSGAANMIGTGLAAFGATKLAMGAGGKGLGSTASAAGKVGSKVLGKAAIPLTIATTGWSMYKGFQDLTTPTGDKTSSEARAFNSTYGDPTKFGKDFGSTLKTITAVLNPSSVANFIGRDLAGAIGDLFGFGGGGNIDPGNQAKNWKGNYKEPRDGGRVHEGIDIALPVGTPIKAVMDGIVSASQTGSGSRSYGEYIKINHGNGLVTLYAHLSARYVKRGDSVSAGDVIGLSGNSGFSTGPHLHFGLYKNGQHQDPSGYVRAAYGSGGNTRKQTNSALNDSSSSGDNSGMSSTEATVSTSGSFFGTGISGVFGSSTSAKSIFESIFGSAGGSLAEFSSGTSSSAMPEPIRGADTTGLMSDSTETSTTTTAETGVGGGYEPGGLDVNYFPNPLTSSTQTKTNGIPNSSGASVVINLTIAKASESEAKRFAKLVKDELENDKLLSRMGSR